MRLKNVLFIIGTLIPLLTMSQTYNKLSPEEQRVIIHKGTEAPFVGQYDKFYSEGTYLCKQCDAPLYKSTDKFNSGCGWPSFDDEIPGAVKRHTDADGSRTEIVCNNCDAHLGHVFMGERFTDKNTRHCVNSISLKFIKNETVVKEEHAIFASGCFWGVEYQLKKVKGVINTTVGYTGGHVDDPSYKQICTGTTGHAEAVEVIFDPTITDFETICKIYFETHDPEQANGQGPDIGNQYRSEVFVFNEKQKAITEKLISILTEKGLHIVTKISPAVKFWPAEGYHQDYYQKTGKQPYCHAYQQKF